MKTQLTNTIEVHRLLNRRSLLHRRSGLNQVAALPALMLLLLTATSVFAGSATWNLNADGDWFNPTNWTPATVPNGPNDTATFGVSNTTDLPFGSEINVEVNGVVFEAGASPFTITVQSFTSFTYFLTISGQGITNNSGVTQYFVVEDGRATGEQGVIQFTNSATAGNLTVLTANSQPSFSGRSGEIWFFDTSTAGSATLIANDTTDTHLGGSIKLAGDSNGGTARVEVFGAVDQDGFSGGFLDISAHNAPGTTVGSIEGSGDVFLGANNLTVGGNNLSTRFSGVIQDGEPFGGNGPGSLTKIGTGKLVLANPNTYTGGTELEGGKLVVNNMTGSGTGTGVVQVNAGRLGGRGTIAGSVTVGTGSGAGAFLSPGAKPLSHRTLTIASSLTFNSDATYRCGFNSSTSRADKVVANGVTINGGAQFSFKDSNASVLPLGTVFTVIDNTAANSIAGTFVNLADGSTFTVGSNTFQANYEGGDGNDLTLTVVP